MPKFDEMQYRLAFSLTKCKQTRQIGNDTRLLYLLVHGHSINFLRVCRADKQIAFVNTAKYFLESGGFLLWIITTSIRRLFLLVGSKA